MRFVCFDVRGDLRTGLISNDKVIDISSAARALLKINIPQDIIGFLNMEDWFETAQKILELVSAKGLSDEFTHNLSKIHLCAPVPCPRQIICLGLNYYAHVEEQEKPVDIPERPLLFSKAPTSVIGPFDKIICPEATKQLDYEIELGVVIGKKGRRISPQNAHKHIAGYTIFNDISARDIQMTVSQWFRGKSFDTFGPMGPCIVTPDELGDENNLQLTLKVNGEVMQSENTQKLIFKMPELISDISGVMTLNPGDFIATGTPGGVGALKNPPRFLKPGDEVEAEISKIGKIKNTVIGENE